MQNQLPTGTVTFLFTDIESSTQLWEKHPDAMKTALARHDLLLHAAVAEHHGHVVHSTGDGLYAAFAASADGVNAVVASQRALQGETWPETGALRVRMALHTGEAELREGDYFGPTLNRTARLMAVGAGGQCLLSQATAALVREQLPGQVTLRDLGEHRLKDLVRPERVYQLVAPDLPADFPPLRSLSAYAHNLPVQLTTLIGREQELSETRQLLAATRLLTLTGPGGTGKTRLALQLAAELLPDYADGVYVVFLAPIREPELVAFAIAQALGVREVGGQPLQASIKDYLANRQALLLLDNFEQVLPAAPSVGELLSACPRLTVVVTSREVLHLYGEQEYATPPLALPEPKPRAATDADYISHLAQSPAVALFVQRAAAAKPGFALTPANAAALAEICVRLDGLPLALELAAAKLKLFPPQVLLARLQQRLALLTGGAQGCPARQRTLRDSIGWSYDLLAPGEQRFFRRLSVFAGGFSLEAAQAVGATDELGMDFLDALSGLVDKSLVRQLELGSGEARFWMLETIREYGLEQLRLHAEEPELRQCHYAACLALFRTGDSYLRGPEAATWLARLESEQDNLRAALQWALDQARYVDMAWLLLAAEYFWNVKGWRYGAAKWGARLLPYRQALPVDQRLAILINFAGSSRHQEEFPFLDEYRAEIVDLMEVCPSKQLQSVAWHFLAQSDADEARAYALAREASEAPELGPEFGSYADHEFVLAAIQQANARILLAQGDVEQAAVLVRDSLLRFRKRGNKAWVGICLGVLGECALLQGTIAEAHANLREAVTIGTAHSLSLILVQWQSLLGLVTLYGGNMKEARRLLEESLRVCLEVKNTLYLARVCTCLAEMALCEGEPQQAADWLGQSLRYHFTPRRITVTDIQRLLVAARLATAQQHYARAATLFGLAEVMHSRFHNAISGPARTLAETALETVRGALDPAGFAEAFEAGQQMSLAQAFSTVLSPSRVAGEHGDPAPIPGID